MSHKLPALTGKEIIRALSKSGFVEIRTRGSHHFLLHSDGRTTVIACHAGETVGSGLLKKILRDCELTREQFRALL